VKPTVEWDEAKADMKKKISPEVAVPLEDDEMLPEYDFSGGVRGKHYLARQTGHTIKVQKKDGTTLVQHITRVGEFKES
jgi:hypothetical protein